MESGATKIHEIPDPYDIGEKVIQRLILGIIRERETVATGDLMESSGLSRSTVLRVADRLCEKGLALRVDKKETKAAKPVGKPQRKYGFNASYASIVAVSISENSLEMAVTDSLARIRNLAQEELYDDEDIASVLGRIVKFIEQTRASPGCKDRRTLGVGIASQGVVDPDAGIIRTAARFPSWGRDLPIAFMLEERLGTGIPVRVDNILRMGALTECRREQGWKSSSIVYVYSGWAGLGAGIVINGRLLRGCDNLAGEIGHMMLNPAETETCSCGSRGCFEQQVSPRRLLSRAGKKNSADLAALFTAYRRGESEAVTLMDEVARWMAIGLSNVNLILNPDLIVLSGVYREAGQGFLDRVAGFARGFAITGLQKTLRLKYSETGGAAPLVGAAISVIDSYFQT